MFIHFPPYILLLYYNGISFTLFYPPTFSAVPKVADIGGKTV